MSGNFEEMRQRFHKAANSRDDTAGEATKRQSAAVVVSMDTIQPKAVDFLWPNWLARSKLHLVGGHPGDGKSTLTLAIASTFSRGGMLPDGSIACVANTLMVLAEDDLEDTVRPRIDLHHGDASKIFALKYVIDEKGNDRALSLAMHVEEMRAVIARYEISIVIIDPITSYLPKADRNAEGDVRDALMPLLKLIEETNIAVIGVMHIGKGGGVGRKPLQQLLGSTAFGAIARVVWMTGELPEDEQPEPGEDGVRIVRKVLGVVKSNISIRPPSLEWSRPLDGAIHWHGTSKHSIDDILSGAPEKKIDAAIENTEYQLRHGPKFVRLIEADAKDEGISAATLKRAYEQLRNKNLVKAMKDGAANGKWLWEWIGAPTTEDVHGPEVAKDELLRSSEDAQSQNLSFFPDSQEEAQEVHDAPLQDSKGQEIEEAQIAHIRRMNFFPSEISDELRDEAASFATELRDGGPKAIEAWRQALASRVAEISTEDYAAGMFAWHLATRKGVA